MGGGGGGGGGGEPTTTQVTIPKDVSNITICHKYVNYDHPGECSPEKDCLW